MKKIQGFGVLALLTGLGMLLQAQTAPAGSALAGSPASRHAMGVSTPGSLVPTGTPTSTPSVTPTPTITSTPTNSPTGTRSPVPTATVSSTATHTPSTTPTSSPTLSPTPSPTWTSTPGVFQFSVSPKPDGQGQIHFQWGTTVPADEVYLRVFTSGLRLVWEDTFNKKEKPEFLTIDPHDVTWNGRDDVGRPMPPGYYICFISVTAGKKTYESSSKTEIP
ncbi:MAG TPA: hypothetical protein VHE12_12810 [bacterium]|nr:hypothetical protein [bacterium]